MAKLGIALALFLALVSGAAAETLVLERFFSRPAVATGVFRNALDGSERGIAVRFKGRWDKASRTLILEEDIRFSDGERQHKTWRLTRTGPRSYRGTREDLVGEAIGSIDDQGRVRLRYRALVGSRAVSFDDVLTLEADGTVRNVAALSWLFIPVGTVELKIRRAR
jgi:hypothetical protein